MMSLIKSQEELYILTNIIVGVVAPEILLQLLERGFVGGLYEEDGVLDRLCNKYGIRIRRFDSYQEATPKLVKILEMHYSVMNVK